MKFIELVKKRKSTRKYSEEAVPRSVIDQCLEAARMAPSAVNSQPWSFIVVDDKETKNKIVEKSMSGIYSSNAFVRNAPVIIVVITEVPSYTVRLGRFFRNVNYSLIDIGIACDHLTLQAEELGVGTCWLGWFSEKAVKKVLGLPKSTKIDVMISMGYPQKSYVKEKKRRTLDEIRRFYK